MNTNSQSTSPQLGELINSWLDEQLDSHIDQLISQLEARRSQPRQAATSTAAPLPASFQDGHRLLHVEDPALPDDRRAQEAIGCHPRELKGGWYIGNFQPEVPFLIGPYGTSYEAVDVVNSTEALYPSEMIFYVPTFNPVGRRAPHRLENTAAAGKSPTTRRHDGS